MTRMRPAWPFVPDPDVGSVPARVLAPRCGAVMLRYEALWGALLDDVVCGRPAGHRPPHRSVQSLDAARERDRARWPVQREQRRQAKRRAALVEALRGWRKPSGR